VRERDEAEEDRRYIFGCGEECQAGSVLLGVADAPQRNPLASRHRDFLSQHSLAGLHTTNI
jgi:hypothetical protein